MTKKRFLLMLLVCVLLSACLACTAHAEEEDEYLAMIEARRAEFFAVPETLHYHGASGEDGYQGGVVERGYLSGIAPFALGDPLELAYALTNAPYILLGERTMWNLTLSGGTEPYTCMALLAYQDDLSLDPFEDSWAVADYFDTNAQSFPYTFTGSGRYFWEFRLTDAAGEYIAFQTRIYETYTAADELDVTTVPGKVNSIIASEITTGMSDYERALALHDWLIYNANYDYTYTHYDASGVLLYGTGVCDSYARAYLMLLTAAGIENVIVSGSAGSGDSSTWGNHAWNLVKLNNEWYHVDCTWDDPNEGGGYERHTYFCVSDETLSKDHSWNRPGNLTDSDGMLVPEASGGDFENTDTIGDYDFAFASIDEYDAGFDAEIAAGSYRARTVGYYTGSETLSSVWELFGTWVGTQVQELANQGLLTAASYGYRGNLFYVNITWNTPDDYLRIDETKVVVAAGSTVSIVPSEAVPQADVFTWTSSDESIAAVTSAYSEETGLTAQITGISAGTTTITATSEDGLSDSIEVVVAGVFAPEFNLALTSEETGITLAWDYIPGLTAYSVMREYNDETLCLETTSENSAFIPASELADSVQQLYIEGVRVVGSNTVARYESSRIEYGEEPMPEFTFALPADIQTVDSEAFSGNTALTAIYIPDGAVTLGEKAFALCTTLEAVRIPSSVTSISADAFEGCPVKTIVLTENSAAHLWAAEHLEQAALIFE